MTAQEGGEPGWLARAPHNMASEQQARSDASAVPRALLLLLLLQPLLLSHPRAGDTQLSALTTPAPWGLTHQGSEAPPLPAPAASGRGDPLRRPPPCPPPPTTTTTTEPGSARLGGKAAAQQPPPRGSAMLGPPPSPEPASPGAPRPRRPLRAQPGPVRWRRPPQSGPGAGAGARAPPAASRPPRALPAAMLARSPLTPAGARGPGGGPAAPQPPPPPPPVPGLAATPRGSPGCGSAPLLSIHRRRWWQLGEPRGRGSHTPQPRRAPRGCSVPPAVGGLGTAPAPPSQRAGSPLPARRPLPRAGSPGTDPSPVVGRV